MKQIDEQWLITCESAYDEILHFVLFEISDIDNVKLTIDDVNDFEFTISFTISNFFNVKINYCSGRSNFLITIECNECTHTETMINGLFNFNGNTMTERLKQCFEFIDKIINHSDY